MIGILDEKLGEVRQLNLDTALFKDEMDISRLLSGIKIGNVEMRATFRGYVSGSDDEAEKGVEEEEMNSLTVEEVIRRRDQVASFGFPGGPRLKLTEASRMWTEFTMEAPGILPAQRFKVNMITGLVVKIRDQMSLGQSEGPVSNHTPKTPPPPGSIE